jgi:hypothetical protein
MGDHADGLLALAGLHDSPELRRFLVLLMVISPELGGLLVLLVFGSAFLRSRMLMYKFTHIQRPFEGAVKVIRGEIVRNRLD